MRGDRFGFPVGATTGNRFDGHRDARVQFAFAREPHVCDQRLSHHRMREVVQNRTPIGLFRHDPLAAQFTKRDAKGVFGKPAGGAYDIVPRSGADHGDHIAYHAGIGAEPAEAFQQQLPH